MMDYGTSPVDVVDDADKWISTYRYEPFLKKWFYIEPSMKGTIQLVDTEAIAPEILEIAEKSDVFCTNAYQAPLKLQIQLNTACNYHCKMCYVSPELQNKELSLEQLRKVFSEAKDIGIVRVNFVGGEIFMRKDIIEVMELAQSYHLLTSCITNGIIPGTAIEKFAPLLHTMYMVQISCNGIGASYDSEHGRVCWESARKSITNVIRQVSASILSYVITDENVEDIPAFIDFAREVKPTIIKFGTVCWSGKSANKGAVQYYSETLETAKKHIQEARAKYPQLQIQSQIDVGNDTPLWEDFVCGYRPYEFYFSPESRDGLYLSAIGKYYPFPLLSDNYDFCVGSISDDILHIWNTSDVLKQLRNVTFSETACGKLGCKRPCGLWNRSYAIAWSGDIYGKIPCALSGWR